MSVRILVADDQQLVRAGLRMIIEAEADLQVVAEADDGDRAVALAGATRPDVVLMDIRMPRMDGVEATRRLTAGAGPVRPRVVILTTFDLDEVVYDALAAGASGFLLKDAPPEDLVRAIRVAARGDALCAPSVTRRLIEVFTQGRPADGVRLGTLTERETEVLRQIARGCSNQEIADALACAASTVKTHVAHVLGKLGCRDRVQAVILAYEAGLVRPGRADPEG